MNIEITELIERIRKKRKKFTETAIAKHENDVSQHKKALSVMDPLTREVVKEYQKNCEKLLLKPEQLSLFPTGLCRVHPFILGFFPRTIKDENGKLKEHMPIREKEFKSTWGRVQYKGPDCGMAEQDLLIVILRKWVKNGYQNFKVDYSDLLDELKYKRQKNGNHRSNNYKILKDSLDRLSLAWFKIEFTQNQKKSTGMVQHIITYRWNDTLGTYTIEVDEWFAQTIGIMYNVTGIDLVQRFKLKHGASKSMHMFFQSQQALDGHVSINYLIEVMNFSPETAKKEITRSIKKAVAELIRIGFFMKKTKIEGNILNWYRTKQVLSGEKLIKTLSPPT